MDRNKKANRNMCREKVISFENILQIRRYKI